MADLGVIAFPAQRQKGPAADGLAHFYRRPRPPGEVLHAIANALRTGAWYRRCAGWTAIVSVDVAGYRVLLKRVERTLDDAIGAINEILEDDRS